MGLGGGLMGSLGGLLTGGPVGGIGGGVGGLLSGGLGGGIGGVAGLTGGGASSNMFPSTRLEGPNFTTAATAIARTSTVSSIALLEVYPGKGTPLIQTLAPALSILKIYLVPGRANIFVYLSASLVTPAVLKSLQTACGVAVTLNPSQTQQLQLQQLYQSQTFQQQMLSQMQQQNMQNLMFQQAINQQSQQFNTLSAAQQAMHNSIMSMLNNTK